MPRNKQTAPSRRDEACMSGSNDNAQCSWIMFNGSNEEQAQSPCVELGRKRRSSAEERYRAVSSRLSLYDFYLTVDSVRSDQSELAYMWTDATAMFRLQSPVPTQLPTAPTFWLYMFEKSSQCVVYYEWTAESAVGAGRRKKRVVRTEVFETSLVEGGHLCAPSAAVQCGTVRWLVESYDSDSGMLCLRLLLSQKLVVDVVHPSEMARRSDPRLRSLMRLVLPQLCDDREYEFQAVSSDNVQPLFDYISRFHRDEEQRRQQEQPNPFEQRHNLDLNKKPDFPGQPIDDTLHGNDVIDRCLPDPQHHLLRPTLRNYQKRAVLWMLQQEKFSRIPQPGEGGPLHQLYVEVNMGGQWLYYNRHGGWFVRERPLTVESPPGGILADEMGLGKTVEVLSLILCHKRPNMPAEEAIKMDDVAVDVKYKDVMNAENSERLCMSEQRAMKRVRRVSSASEDSACDGVEQNDVSWADIQIGEDKQVFDDDSDSAVRYKHCRLSREERLRRRSIKINNASQCLECDGEFGSSKSADDSQQNAAATNVSEQDKELCEPLDNECVQACAENSSRTHKKRCFVVSGKTKQPRAVSKHSKLVQLRRASAALSPDDLYGASIDSVVLTVCYQGMRPKFYRPGVGVVRPAAKATSSRVSMHRRLAETHYRRILADNSSLQQATRRLARQQERLRRLRERFSCLCGRWRPGDDNEDDDDEGGRAVRRRSRRSKPAVVTVQCETCGLWQHASCVGYDVQDRRTGGSYHCPQCWSLRPAVISAATLIVSPTAICQQWVDEIDKHVRSSASDGDGGAGLKVLVYSGVRSDSYVQPRTLASHDVVITTYAVLQKELNYVHVGRHWSRATDSSAAEDSPTTPRRAQKYLAPPTPLLCVEWWRVCLDEAQMVECTTTRTAVMARRLACVNRWCVTGTPVSRSLSDLFGLLLFIGLEPFGHEHWWKQLVYHPYLHGHVEPARAVLRRCFWRSAKKDVAAEIADIPQQSERCVWLHFSPLESYFYRWRRAKLSSDALRVIDRHGDLQLRLCDMPMTSVEQLMQPLLALRQACCQPQLAGGEAGGQQLGGGSRTGPLTMSQLLVRMVRRATVDAEEAHRQRTAALCGLAALHVELKEPAAAVEKYRSVLRHADQLAGQLKTDLLQRLHAAHNLHQVLTTEQTRTLSCQDDDKMPVGSHQIAPTTRDAQLPQYVTQLRTEYVSRYDVLVDESERALHETTGEVTGACEQQENAATVEEDEDSDECWMGSVILLLASRPAAAGGGAASLIDRLTDELVQLSSAGDRNTEKQADLGTTKRAKCLKSRLPADTMLHKFSSPGELHALLTTRVADLELVRERVLNALASLMRRQADSLVAAAVDCHLSESAIGRDNSEDDSKAAADGGRAGRLSREAGTRDVCVVCETERPLLDYERRLFYVQAGRVDSQQVEGVDGSVVQLHGQLARGSWRDNETGHVLRLLLTWARQAGAAAVGGDAVLQRAARHVRRLDAMKREFRHMRALWSRLSDRVSAHSELAMATTRLRLRRPDDDAAACLADDTAHQSAHRALPHHVIEPCQLGSHQLQLQAELTAAEAELRRRLGQRLYLTNLQTNSCSQSSGGSDARTGDDDGSLVHSDASCPICARRLGASWSVLRCGHSFCVECTHTMLNMRAGRRQTVKCAVCRDWSSHSDVAHVCADTPQPSTSTSSSTSSSSAVQPEAPVESSLVNDDDECRLTVRGSYSTKVLAVVRCTLAVLQREPRAKLLVFCSWTEPLDVAAAALADNGVEARRLHAPGCFQRHLREFRRHDGQVRVLLLPVQLGARGLNLVEASHVLLMNPLLDTAAERQAVGRVHRLGQRHATTVHRLIVRDTVEERLRLLQMSKQQLAQDAQTAAPSERRENELTLHELRQLFDDD